MSALRIECGLMDTLPTWNPRIRRTAELHCDVYLNDVIQPYKVVFPQLAVRWYPWPFGIWVDAGRAQDAAETIVLDFGREPVERVDRNTMRVLAIPVTGSYNDGLFAKPILGMTLPECYARRDPTRRGVYVVDAVTLTGTI